MSKKAAANTVTEKIEVVYVDPNDLIPSEYNPRILSPKKEEQIRKSLLRYGFTEPVVVNIHDDRKNVIIGGHQRVKIALDLGMQSIPAVFIELPEEREKELNIRLNDGGDWDYEKLKDNFDDVLLRDTGFDDVLGFELDQSTMTPPSDLSLPEIGQTAEAAEQGEAVTAKVVLRLGAFTAKVDAPSYVEWKGKLHKEFGYSDAALATECLKRLGIEQ